MTRSPAQERAYQRRQWAINGRIAYYRKAYDVARDFERLIIDQIRLAHVAGDHRKADDLANGPLSEASAAVQTIGECLTRQEAWQKRYAKQPAQWPLPSRRH